MYRLAIGFVAAAGILAPTANAAPHSISNTTPVFINGNFNGSFDVRPFLGASGKVTQASILLHFIDDIEIAGTVPRSTTSYRRTGVEYDKMTQYGAISYPTHFVEMLQSKGKSVTDLTAETATASITGETKVAGTAALAANQKAYSLTTRKLDRTSCLQTEIDWFGGSYCTLAEAYFTEDTTDYYGKLGTFDIRFDPIGPQALADLNSDGLLDFNISFGSGQDATLLESRIDFDVVQRAAIPEPSLLALLGIGLLVMRQRRRRSH